MHQWNPEEYAKHSAAQLVWARELIARLELKGDESVLDVGSGDGKVTAEIAAAVPRGRVVGLDGSPEMVRFARAHYGIDRFPNWEFVCLDARRIALNYSFDVVFSNAALHWIADHPAILLGVSRVMRRGGRLIVSCGGRGNAADMLQVVEAVIDQDRWRKYFAGFVRPYNFHGPDQYLPLDAAGDACVRMVRLEVEALKP